MALADVHVTFLRVKFVTLTIIGPTTNAIELWLNWTALNAKLG